MTAWDDASALNEQGRALATAGDLDAAVAAYRHAVETCPTFEPAWFNLGLVHKARREWPQAYECNRRAAELVEGSGGESAGEPAWWNLGIAATALRDWRTARQAWRKYGINVPAGEGPGADNAEDAEWRSDMGRTPVRINPDGAAEVVWCDRIDPARAVIRNIPLPDSGRRWGEIVLHDGVPNGERRLGDQVRYVFDELDVWAPSDVPTLEVEVEVASPADAEALSLTFAAAGYCAEDWTSSTRLLCAACSTGNPDGEHHHDPDDQPFQRGRRFGLAVPPADAAGLLRQWAKGGRRKARRHGPPAVVV